MINFLKQKILTPVQSMRRRYLPMLSVYFAAGMAGITSVSMTFFKRDVLQLTSAQLATAMIYITIPWTIKMLFGSIIDSIKIFGNNRKSYIIIGTLLQAVAPLFYIDITTAGFITGHLGQFVTLIIGGTVLNLGIVIADIAADTMVVEVADQSNEQELGIVQVLSRLSFQIGGLIAALLTGILAKYFSFTQVFTIAMFIPFIGVLGILFAQTKDIETQPLDKPIVIKSILFGVFTILSSLWFVHADVVIFVSSLLFVGFLMHRLSVEITPEYRTNFLYACMGVFLFRCVPYVGEGLVWWLTGSVGMTEMDFGTLRQISYFSSIIIVWLLTDYISKSKIRGTLLFLALADVALQTPELLIYYNLHSWTGLSAKSLIYVSSAMSSPLAALSMIPLGVLIARHAPATKRALYFSTTASLMNVSLQAGNLITSHLNKLYLVTRENFANLGQILIIVILLSIVFPLLGVMVIKKEK